MINSFINSDKFPKNNIIESISNKIGDVDVLIEVDNKDLIGFSLSCNKNNIISFAFLCNLVDFMKIYLRNYYKDKLDSYEILLNKFLYDQLVCPFLITRWSSF